MTKGRMTPEIASEKYTRRVEEYLHDKKKHGLNWPDISQSGQMQ